MTVAKYIQSNICEVRKLVKAGLVPLRVMNNYDIYLMYQALDYEPSQMKRLAMVAKTCKINPMTVRRAIQEMEKKC